MAGVQQISDSRPIVLVGGGGHSQSICAAGSPERLAAYVDVRESPLMPLTYLGNDSSLLEEPGAADRWRVHIAVVGIGAEALVRRSCIIGRYSRFEAATIIACDASVAEGSEIAPGCAVMRQAVVNKAKIGAHTVINTRAVVEHGCTIGSNCFIGPGAVICGEVTIGDNTFVGAGAIVRNGVSIPSCATIGMGAVVVNTIDKAGVYVGTPAHGVSEKTSPKPVIIIAEAGVNHDGSLATAIEMVAAAAEAGADYVKFQTFKAENLVTATADKAAYQKEACGESESQLGMLERLELSAADFITLSKECAKRNIGFMSTPFDSESVDELAPLGMDYWKIPSGEITNLPLLSKIGGMGQKVILSTGMSTLEEVDAAVSVLERCGTPRSNIILLHCNTQYPTPPEDVNLRALDSLRTLGCASVGYSDHTSGTDIPLAAVALGASVIEKHFTLDRNRKGPDHKASLEPHELKDMVSSIRRVSASLGSVAKAVTQSEKPNKAIARKSIVAATDIAEGDVFNETNLCAKRPGSGISPMLWHSLTGRTASRSYRKDELIDFSEL